jgi:putative PIN family toxin of toxin-antitoxin system
VVVDTNVFVSGVIWSGPPSSLMTCVWRRDFDLVSSEDILAELLSVLSRPHLQVRLTVRKRTPEEVVMKIRRIALIVEPAEIIPPAGLRDLKDLPVLRCAVGGKAQTIVSGDRDLLELKEFNGIPIVTPRRLLGPMGW